MEIETPTKMVDLRTSKGAYKNYELTVTDEGALGDFFVIVMDLRRKAQGE